MKSSVLVATYCRPDDLRRCLSALERLEPPADEVVIVHRPTDEATRQVLVESWTLPLRAVEVFETGVVAAMNRGLDAVTGDFVMFLDDDAAPLPDWLARVEAHYRADPMVGAVGGRDILHVDGTPIQPSEKDVGTISWYGRLVGAHHIGIGTARHVAVLKGVNMGFRMAALRNHRADPRLLGEGAQVHFEVGLCTNVRRAGWSVLYDPTILVNHYPSVRHDSDKRSGFAYDAQFNKAHNEQLMILDALKPWQRPVFVMWSILIGTSDVVGLAQLPRVALKRRGAPLQRFRASVAGRLRGTVAWLRSVRHT